MSLVDHDGSAEFPYSKDDVFEAVLAAVPTLKKMKVGSSDKLSGRIVVKAGVSLRSWGENIPVSITEVSPGRTHVSITSTPKTGVMLGGAFDLGKNRENIEKLITAASEILQTKPPAAQDPITAESAAPSPADTLQTHWRSSRNCPTRV